MMKKNKMMRIASVLLVAVILTTCAISGTFAKYVTKDNGTDTARVAKWGVEVLANSYDMFTDKYTTDDSTANFSGSYSVQSSDGKDVLAPGTAGSFADIAIKGTPEVAVNVSVVGDVDISDNWVVDGSFYCPVTVTVGTTAISGLDYDSATAFETAIKTAIDGKSAQYAPNTNLDGIYDNNNLDLAWNWAFEGAADGKQTDIKDTALGDLAVTQNLTIKIGIAITVTQID